MSFVDKAKHKAEEALGKGKQATGEATGDKDLERDGQVDQGKADVKQAGDKVKDAVEKH